MLGRVTLNSFTKISVLMVCITGIVFATKFRGSVESLAQGIVISDVQDGIVLHMALEDDPTDGILDQSTYANHGTCTNCPSRTSDAKVGTFAYTFDRGEYYEVGPTADSELEPQEFTISFWVKVLDAVGTDTILGLCGQELVTGKQGYRFTYSQEQNAIRFELGHAPPDPAQNGLITNVKASDEIKLNRWYHLTGRWDGENLAIFVNANLSNENYYKNMDADTTPIGYACNSRTFFVGSGLFYSDTPALWRHANLILDDLRIYDRALTNTEIGQLACGADGDCISETKLCPKQLGVCAASEQTCTGGTWPGCNDADYLTSNAAYQAQEINCGDGLDNDCDGQTDRSDADCTLIRVSRDIGVAPLAIFFDAINDYEWSFIEQSDFVWDFGDDSPEFNGYLAAHVYELDDTALPTMFTVTLTIKQHGQVIASDTKLITVSPFTGRTLCASLSGNFGDCPSTLTADHFTDLGLAWEKVDTNTRLLLRRGDEWISNEGYTKNVIPGPVIIGAYGQGDRPKITFTNQDQPTFLTQASADWRFLDLHIEGGGGGDGFGASCLSSGGDCRDLLVQRIRMENNDAVISVPGVKDGFFIFDSSFENLRRYVSYNYFGEDIAFVNVVVHESGGHVYRIGAPERLLVYANQISDSGTGEMTTHDTLTVRGAGFFSRYLLVKNNVFQKPDWLVQLGSQNLNSAGPFRYIVVEGNRFTPYPGQSGTGVALILDGYDAIIRNNEFLDTEYAIDIGERDTFDDSRRIGIYNNTVYLSPASRKSGFLRLDPDANPQDIRIMNNLLTGAAGMWTVFRGENIDLAQIESNNNIWNVPNYLTFFGHDLTSWQTDYAQDTNSLTADPLLLSTDSGNPDFLMLSSASPAIDAGISVPVFADRTGRKRPQGGNWDIGACEFQPEYNVYLPLLIR